MSFLPSLPADATLLDVSAAYPEPYGALMAYHEIVMREPGPLSPGERELIATYVSHLNGCQYCIGIHGACAELLGIDKSLVAGLPDSAGGNGLEPRYQPLFRYARTLTEAPERVSRADAAAIFDAGWPEETLFDLVSVVVTYSLFNRLVTGLGIGPNPAYYLPAAKRLTAGLR